MNVEFTKMQGLGNDFIVIDDREGRLNFNTEEVITLCDRHKGIGADGLIIIRSPLFKGSDFSWLFYNSDGTVPEMCGNGIRCAAKFVIDRNFVEKERSAIVIDTGNIPRAIEVLRREDNTVARATVDMGCASFYPKDIQTTLPANATVTIEIESEDGLIERTVEGIIDATLTLEDDLETRDIPLTCISMGNPHAVINVADIESVIADAPVSELGPVIETLPEFEASINVEFIEVIDRSHINMRVWERGCGETMACGTGACAAALSAFIHGWCDNEVVVSLLGGTLAIAIDPQDLRIFMTGDADEVYQGIIPWSQ